MSTVKFKCRVCGSSSYEHPVTLKGSSMGRDEEAFKCRKCGAMHRIKKHKEGENP